MCSQDWPHFSHAELSCRGSGECRMDNQFMLKLVNLRKRYGKPLVITSAYRSEAHNKAIGGAKGSAHTQGKAVDISIARGEAYKVLALAIECGFTGIGVSQKGANRFLHIDTIDDPDIRPTIWSY